ncbi:hypothetical protein [Bacillus arachidis]|uniref:hypothetical protein n=1 Tax=Bacillus arachidis TaxID=2819290 RepID=UPI001FB7092C|nr:hypothetical protein [Bacillus arachidis]
MKKRYLFLIIVIILIFFGGYKYREHKNEQKEQVIKDKAEKVAIQYFKEQENIDITVTEFEFAPSDFGSIFVSGHVTNEPTRKILVDVNYKDNYKVESTGLDKEKK